MSESQPRTPPHSTTSHDTVSPITPFAYVTNPDDPDDPFPRSGRKKEQDGTPVTTKANATRILDKGVLKRTVKEIEKEQKKIEKEQKKVLKKLEKDVEDCYICGENSDVYTSCKHFYCEDCILSWIVKKKSDSTNSSCPYCRENLSTNNLFKIIN